MKKNRKTSGIQRRYLKYTAALLGLALLLSSVGVIISVRNRLTRSIIDKYEFMTERMGLTLENMYRKSDETTAECILYDDVQQSLKNQGLEEVRYIPANTRNMGISPWFRTRSGTNEKTVSPLSASADLKNIWERNIQRQSGSGQRIHCSVPEKRLFLSGDMLGAWSTPTGPECCFLKWSPDFCRK